MIKKLRTQITITVGAVLTLFMVIIVASVNIANYNISLGKIYNALEITAATNGEISTDYISGNELTSDQMFYRSLTFFSVFLTPDNEPVSIKNATNSGMSDEELVDVSKAIVLSKHVRGLTSDNVAFLTRRFLGGKIVVFVDANSVVSSLQSTIKISIVLSIIAIGAIWWLSSAMAKLLVLPVKKAFDKQKAFISDAGHELKTPVAVISANAEVLEDEIGRNKWLSYIKSETGRMNTLIQSLLTLSKIEDLEAKSEFKQFDLSYVAEGAAMPFEVLAFEKGAIIDYDIGEGIIMTGNEDKIKQLFAILIDNAVKHCYRDGKIKVSVQKSHQKIILEVSNTGDEIPVKEREKIFERFYRVDKARNREEGRYGLGLAIAKSITELHGGSISVYCQNSITTFKVVL